MEPGYYQRKSGCRSSHCYPPLSPQVTSNDKTPTVISSALEKHNQDPEQASKHELIQLLPEGKGKDPQCFQCRRKRKRIHDSLNAVLSFNWCVYEVLT